jgi:hypothetical protein
VKETLSEVASNWQYREESDCKGAKGKVLCDKNSLLIASDDCGGGHKLYFLSKLIKLYN